MPTSGLPPVRAAGMLCFCVVGLRVHLWQLEAQDAAQRVHEAVSRVQHSSRGAITPAEGSTQPVSWVPFPEQLRREHGTRHIHPQKYRPLPQITALPEASGERRRTQSQNSAEIMTVETTTALKIHVDWSAIDPAKAQPYSTCFSELSWFKWQWPAGTQPPCLQPRAPTCSECPGVATCATDGSNTVACWMEAQRDSNFNGCDDSSLETFTGENSGAALCSRSHSPSVQNCWGVCVKEDVLHEGEMKQWMVNSVEASVAELESYFRVRPRDGNLVLASDLGTYASWYASKGLSATALCAKDTQMLYRLPVDGSYCTDGVNADIVFFPVMTQKTNGVAGWGASSLSDQNGRPILLLMGWSVPTTAQERVDFDHRALVLHELVHGMGFSIYEFQDQYDSNGKHKKLVEQKTYTDIDGNSELIWEVVSERVVQTARAYFDAPDLTGVPLLGANQLGDSQSGSHWETRVLDDEFLAYGSGSAVSDFTLAMMEDLGFYLANHSKAQCMFWGRNQGAAFVWTRCGSRSDDLSVSFLTSDATCDRSYPKTFGGTVNGKTYPGNPFLIDRCASPCCEGDGVCESNLGPGRVRPWAAEAGDTFPSCNAECWTPGSGLAIDGGIACGSIPYGSIFASGRAKAAEVDQAFADLIYALGALAGVIFVMFMCLAYYLLVQENHRLLVRMEQFTNTGIMLGGFFCLALGLWLLFFIDEDAGLFERSEMVVFTIGAACVVTFGAAGLLGVHLLEKGFDILLRVHVWTLVVFCLAKLCVAAVLIIWVIDSYTVMENTSVMDDPTAESEPLWYHTGWTWLDDTLTEGFVAFNAYACNVYRECCWSYPQRDLVNATATCMSTHAGATVGAVASTSQDPSAPGFCVLATGKELQHGQGKSGVCRVYDGLNVFDMNICYASFCNAGVRGFQTFLYKIFQWAQEQMFVFLAFGLVLGTCDSVVILSSFTLLFIEKRACKRIGLIHLIQAEMRKSELLDAYKQLDEDQSGTLDLSEFKMLLQMVGAAQHQGKIDAYQNEQIFNSLDKDASGTINFEEFVEWWETQDAKVRDSISAYEKKNGQGMVRKDDIKRWCVEKRQESALARDTSISEGRRWPATAGAFSRNEWNDGVNFLAILNAHKDFNDETPEVDDAISDELLKQLLEPEVDCTYRLHVAFETAQLQFGVKPMITAEQLTTEDGWNFFLDADGSGSVSRKERKAAEVKLEVTLLAYIAELRKNIARLANLDGRPQAAQDAAYAARFYEEHPSARHIHSQNRYGGDIEHAGHFEATVGELSQQAPELPVPQTRERVVRPTTPTRAQARPRSPPRRPHPQREREASTINPASQISALDSLFKQYDTDGNGALDEHEVAAMIASVRRVGGVDQNYVNGLMSSFARFDTDGNGTIDRSEFEILWLHLASLGGRP